MRAVCPDGLAAVTTEDAVHLLWEGGKSMVAPLNLPSPQSASGPVVDSQASVVVVPDQDGTVVRAYAVGPNALEPIWLLESGLLPGGAAGLALDGDGMLYVASRSGQMVATDVAKGPAADHRYWPLGSTLDVLGTGPVVRTPGEVLLAAAGGGFFVVTEDKRFAPDYVEGKRPFEGLIPLRLDGVAGISGTGEAVEALFQVSAASLPGMADDAGPAQIGWGECTNSSLSVPGADGTFAFVCDDVVTIAVAPDYAPSHYPWPTARGRGNSGCL